MTIEQLNHGNSFGIDRGRAKQPEPKWDIELKDVTPKPKEPLLLNEVKEEA